MALQRLGWTYSDPRSRESVFLPSVFAEWHRARKLRMELTELLVDGARVAPVALERVNLWLSANGAWTCGLLEHFDCERVLCHVLDQGGLVRIGPTAGGRWPASRGFKQILRDGGQCVQTGFVFEVCKSA